MLKCRYEIVHGSTHAKEDKCYAIALQPQVCQSASSLVSVAIICVFWFVSTQVSIKYAIMLQQ